MYIGGLTSNCDTDQIADVFSLRCGEGGGILYEVAQTVFINQGIPTLLNLKEFYSSRHQLRWQGFPRDFHRALDS